MTDPLYFVGEKDYDWKRDKRERWEANLIPQIDRAHGSYSIGGVFDT